MERRTVLTAAGASLPVGLAGCVTVNFGDDGGGDDGGSDDDGPAETAATDDADDADAGGDSLQRAVAALADNNEQFESYAETVASSVEDAPTTFDDGAVTDRVERARRNLSAADAPDGVVTALSGLADAHERAGPMFVDYATGAESYSEMQRRSDRNRYETATTALFESHRAIGDVRPVADEVLDTLGGIDTGALSELSVSVAPFRDAVVELRRRADFLDVYLDGMEPFLAGMADLQTAETAMDRGSFARAERRYEAAGTHYRDAVAGFDDSRLDGGVVIPQAALDQVRCRIEALADASPTLAEAARAYERGDRTEGDRLSRQARETVSRCQQGSSTGGGNSFSLRTGAF
ncbi:hypothetical protein SAMN05216388_102237 [Halorientalis persicus]|uniref:Uncharacterized protein n=1 Tax=Halorientalis persicus TaxID=1367881 RepID=A0A1H8TGE9_9EURY|nr:hypothetical protein [Halorientalis persicus]SEO89583.1 hypothetical protein SAMN05216388_102237 [Halorientalis persicus]